MIASTLTNQPSRDTMLDRYASLTTLQQQVLFLTAVDGQCLATVAAKLDLDPEAVERIAAAARGKLRAVAR